MRVSSAPRPTRPGPAPALPPGPDPLDPLDRYAGDGRAVAHAPRVPPVGEPYVPGFRDTSGWSVDVAAPAEARAHEALLEAGRALAERWAPGLTDDLPATLGSTPALTARVEALDEALRGELLRPAGSAPDADLKNARLQDLAAERYEAWLDLVEDQAARRRRALPLAARLLYRLQRRSPTCREGQRATERVSVRVPRGEAEVWRGLRLGYRLLGAAAPDPGRLAVVQRRPRARYDARAGRLDVGARPTVSTVLHELGHAAEAARPAWAAAARAWRDARSRAAGLEGLHLELDDLVPEAGYGPGERVVADHFVDAYVGKVYGHDATEVVSMGLEVFASAEAFVALYERDREHVHLLLGMLAEDG